MTGVDIINDIVDLILFPHQNNVEIQLSNESGSCDVLGIRNETFPPHSNFNGAFMLKLYNKALIMFNNHT